MVAYIIGAVLWPFGATLWVYLSVYFFGGLAIHALDQGHPKRASTLAVTAPVSNVLVALLASVMFILNVIWAIQAAVIGG